MTEDLSIQPFVIVPYVIYPFDVLVSIENTETLVQRIIDDGYSPTKFDLKNLRINSPDTWLGRTVMLGNGATVIRLNSAPITNESIAVLAHEAIHAVHFLIDHIGIKHDSEVISYTVQYLIKCVLNHFRPVKETE